MRGLSVKRLFYGLGLAILNVAVIWCAIYLWGVQSYGLLALLLLGALALNALFIFPGGYPYRYLAPAAVFMILLVIYPIVYTVYVALTNYGTGNILTKEQVIQQFENRYVLDPDAGNYTFRVYENAHSDRIFLFTAPDGRLLLGRSGELEDVTGRDEADVIPPGYSELERRDVIRLSTELSALTFEYEEEYQLRMRSASAFALYIKQYSYDAGRDELVDLISGVVYKPVNGAFEAPDGTRLTPGFRIVVGLRNFQRLFGNPQITGPFVRVFLWTITWALLSVGTTFAVGLFLALLLNDPHLRFRRLYRSLLILPYAVPAFISALIWQGLYHTEFGVINRALEFLFDTRVPWLQDPFYAKVALVILNLWLGFPYMMIVCLGALQSINSEMYEAALVDGATTWQQFRYVTLPLLMVSVAPLLVSSFSFNFNNFSVIYLLTRGRPPIPGAQTPAGHTDILISYTYRLAFESGRGVDYGLASAVTLIIFLITGTITFINFRFTGALEDVRENV
ncbi:MAG: maltose ABC transporter permease MalF [Firmicutes bacterium]|nr:maltose ABC transporter permease MalF [Bacillota bacterium]